MSIVLFNSPITSSKRDVVEMAGAYPRVGVASIAAYLLEGGIDVSIIDPESEGLDLDGIKSRIQEIQPEVVGLPAFTEEVFDAAAVAGAIKEVSSNIMVVVGGPHPSALPVETLEEFASFDIAVIGEGELTFFDIATGKPLELIPGIAYRAGRRIKHNEDRALIPDLNSLPFPAWHLYDLAAYRGGGLCSGFARKGNHLELPVEGGRGCPFGCIFCFRTTGRRMRFRAPKRVVDDIERCVRESEADQIYFVEGTFGVDRDLAIEVCDELVRRGLYKEITWSAGPRVDRVDIELLTKMKESGCSFLGFGVESGDPEILRLIGKNTYPEQAIKAFEMTRKVGIKTEANFIIGLPGETEETILRTIGFAKRLDADYANFAILVPFPGTEVYKSASQGNGDIKVGSKDWRLYGKQLGEALEHEHLPYRQLKKLQMKAYRTFYLRPSKVGALMSRVSLPRIIYALKHLV